MSNGNAGISCKQQFVIRLVLQSYTRGHSMANGGAKFVEPAEVARRALQAADEIEAAHPGFFGTEPAFYENPLPRPRPGSGRP